MAQPNMVMSDTQLSPPIEEAAAISLKERGTQDHPARMGPEPKKAQPIKKLVVSDMLKWTLEGMRKSEIPLQQVIAENPANEVLRLLQECMEQELSDRADTVPTLNIVGHIVKDDCILWEIQPLRTSQLYECGNIWIQDPGSAENSMTSEVIDKTWDRYDAYAAAVFDPIPNKHPRSAPRSWQEAGIAAWPAEAQSIIASVKADREAKPNSFFGPLCDRIKPLLVSALATNTKKSTGPPPPWILTSQVLLRRQEESNRVSQRNNKSLLRPLLLKSPIKLPVPSKTATPRTRTVLNKNRPQRGNAPTQPRGHQQFEDRRHQNRANRRNQRNAHHQRRFNERPPHERPHQSHNNQNAPPSNQSAPPSLPSSSSEARGQMRQQGIDFCITTAYNYAREVLHWH